MQFAHETMAVLRSEVSEVTPTCDSWNMKQNGSGKRWWRKCKGDSRRKLHEALGYSLVPPRRLRYHLRRNTKNDSPLCASVLAEGDFFASRNQKRFSTKDVQTKGDWTNKLTRILLLFQTIAQFTMKVLRKQKK